MEYLYLGNMRAIYIILRKSNIYETGKEKDRERVAPEVADKDTD